MLNFLKQICHIVKDFWGRLFHTTLLPLKNTATEKLENRPLQSRIVTSFWMENILEHMFPCFQWPVALIQYSRLNTILDN